MSEKNWRDFYTKEYEDYSYSDLAQGYNIASNDLEELKKNL